MLTAAAYAKINWSLSICGTRPDGYHELDMLMQRVSLHDELSFELSDSLSLSVNGKAQPADSKDLVMQAARALNAYAGSRYGAAIQLSKHIPSRAGLGGGSADCACALIRLNRIWDLGLSAETLESIGVKLGADVPYCLRGCLCRVRGIGEELTPLRTGPEFYLVMITPGDGLSTPQVFRRWNELQIGGPCVDNDALADALNRGDLEVAQEISRNDLEAPAIDLMPEIGKYLETFRGLGSPFVRMSGSGSTVYAAFRDESSAHEAANAVPGSIVVKTLGFTEQL